MEDQDLYKVEGQKGLSALLFTLLLVVGIFCIPNCFVIVDQTKVGVLKTLGIVEQYPLSPGLHLKLPIIQDVVLLNTTIQTIEMTEKKKNAIKVSTNDGLPVSIDLAVQYHIIPEKAPKIVSEISNYNIWLISKIRAKVRDVIAEYNVDSLYSDKRTEIQRKIEVELKKELEPYGFEITDVLIRKIELPEQVVDAIEKKLKAKQEAEQMKYVLEKTRQEAEKKMIEANATAKYNEIVAKSIRDNPEILQYRKLEILEELAKNNNKVFIVPGSNDLILNLPNKE